MHEHTWGRRRAGQRTPLDGADSETSRLQPFKKQVLAFTEVERLPCRGMLRITRRKGWMTGIPAVQGHPERRTAADS